MKKVFLFIGLLTGSLLVGALLVTTFLFTGKDHSTYDRPRPPSAPMVAIESREHGLAAKQILSEMANAPKLSRDELMRTMRHQLDGRGQSMQIDSVIRPVHVDGLDAEWVIAPNAMAGRRLLYLHGGGYVMGSPKSHRLITSRMSEVSAAAVLSVNYRLQPENTRMAGIEDCRHAYSWLLKNGPDSASEMGTLIVAGDSSGGNLALSTIAWARDTGMRAADAVVVFAPQTDATLASPSLLTNIATDVMQGQTFGPLVKAPKVFSLGLSFLMNRINPRNPLVSPLLGDLSNLPPTLVQVSEAEMFLDDAVRYVNKANAHGSEAVVQSWPGLMHVWHAFQVPEADEAFGKVNEFLMLHAPIAGVPNANG